MNGSSTTIRRTANHEIRGFRNFIWISMLMSLAVVFFGMQLMMVGPLKGRLDGIQTRLELSDQNMKKLVSTRDSVWRTNDLLSGLEDQASRLNKLQSSLSDIQNLRNRIQNEAEAATVALSALDRMVSVQNRILRDQKVTQQASEQLTEMQKLQETIVQISPQTDVAANSVEGFVALQNRVIAAASGYENASESVASLADLTQKLVDQSDDLRLAAERFDQFVALKDAVNKSTEGLATAQESARQLTSLKDEVLKSTSDIATAQVNARVLVAMNDKLSSSDLQLNTASQNLESLVQLQKSLLQQSSEVANAIQNLEIMEDFQTEVAAHVKTLGALRRTLVDIAMMESTMGKVAQMVEPLSEIGNLRRLSDTEVREAARVILDRRMTRFTQTDSVSASGDSLPQENSEESSADLVPLPPEAR